MTPTRAHTITPSLHVFSTDSGTADAFAAHISGYGLQPIVTLPQITTSLTREDLVAWIVTDLVAAAPTIINTLSLPDNFPGKVLIVFPIDKPKTSVAEAEAETQEINGYINKIIDLCRRKQIDVRCVAHHGTYTATSVGEGNSLSAIIHQLNNGKSPRLDQQPLFPLPIDQLIPTIIAIWFDRGHRNQKILVRGQPLSPSEYNELIQQHTPSVPPTPLPLVWLSGERLNPDDIIEIKSDISTLFPIINNSYSPPPPPQASPPPPPAIPPSSPPPPPLVPAKPVVAPQSTSPWPWYIKYALITLIAIVIAYISITYGLFAVILARYAHDNFGGGETLTQALQNLDDARNRYHKLSVIPILDTYFDNKYTAVTKQLLYAAVQSHAVSTFSMIFGSQPGDPYDEITQSKLLLDQLYTVESRTNGSPTTINTLDSLRQLLTLYPQIVLPEQKLTVLVLLQNNLELRPTGGFIGSAGLITLDRGKVLDVTTRNSYDLDSNLHGLVTPPAEITQYLGESSWYFRDSNWHPDFVEAAKSASWFLGKEWGSAADIVIGINLNTFKLILTSLGGLTLPNGTAINADNLFVTALNHQDSVNAAANQPEFMSMVFTALINQLNQADASTKLKVLSNLYRAIEQGDLTLFTNRNHLNPIMSDVRLNGTIYTPSCAVNLPEACFADHYYLNQANVGINKANYYVTTQASYQIVLNGTTIAHTHTLTLENTSPNATWPAGSYKAYYRAYLPLSATNIQVSTDNQIVPDNQLSVLSTPPLRQVGWYYELKPQSKTQIVVSYQLPQPPNLKSYQFFVQKQPGVFPHDYTVSITGPTAPFTTTGTATSHLFFPVKFSP